MSDSEMVFSSHQDLQSGRWPFAPRPTRRYFWRRWCNVGVCRAKSQREVAVLESSYGGQSSRWSCVFFWRYVWNTSYVKNVCTSQRFICIIIAKRKLCLSPNWFLCSDSLIYKISQRARVWKSQISQRKALINPDILQSCCRQLALHRSYCLTIGCVCDTNTSDYSSTLRWSGWGMLGVGA